MTASIGRGARPWMRGPGRHGSRPPVLLAVAMSALGAAWELFAWALLPEAGTLAPKGGARGASMARPQWTMLRAEGGDKGKSDEERIAFMDSPVGQAIGAFAKFLADSPLNDGKIWFAKMQAGEYDVPKVRAQVDAYIKQNPVVMFSFSKCPFCIKAKKELTELGANYFAVELDQMDKEGLQIRAELADRTKRTSMPNIFIGGQSVGGCNDGPGIMTLKKQGELTPMLEKAGAMR